jgi:F420H(2)-dependent quinone reductase
LERKYPSEVLGSEHCATCWAAHDCHDDWFDLAAGAAIEQACQTNNHTVEVGYPRSHSFQHGEIVVERASGIVAGSAGGSARHPGWIFNLAKHPDQVWIEIGNRCSKLKVRPETLDGEERDRIWRQIIGEAPVYTGTHQRRTAYSRDSAHAGLTRSLSEGEAGAALGRTVVWPRRRPAKK